MQLLISFQIQYQKSLYQQIVYYKKSQIQLLDQNITSKMFKKPDSWEAGIKMVSKFLGFEVQQQQHQSHINQRGTGLLKLNSSNQMPTFYKSQQKTFQLKQKWRKLMKFPSKTKYNQIIELLKQGSALEDETWIWMLRNTQKISPQLYNLKKEQLRSILFPKNPFQLRNDFPQSNIQIQYFEQHMEFKNMGKQILNQPRKRKVSITKSGMYNKNSGSMTGRMSIGSQASTFSSQTHKSNDIISTQLNQYQMMHQNGRCQTNFRNQNLYMKQSHMSIYSYNQNYRQDNSLSLNEPSNEMNLQYLPSKINHPVLTDIIGSFLLQREDISYSVTLFNMAATFFYYTNSNEMKTFILLNNVAVSQFYVHYLSRQSCAVAQILEVIVTKIRNNCPSVAFLKNFRLQNFIQNWLYGFFYSICENGTQIKQKIVGYLVLNAFSIDAIAKVCQSLIFSLRKVINQGQQDKIYDCLQNPKLYLDKQIFFDQLFQSENN